MQFNPLWYVVVSFMVICKVETRSKFHYCLDTWNIWGEPYISVGEPGEYSPYVLVHRGSHAEQQRAQGPGTSRRTKYKKPCVHTDTRTNTHRETRRYTHRHTKTHTFAETHTHINLNACPSILFLITCCEWIITSKWKKLNWKKKLLKCMEFY